MRIQSHPNLRTRAQTDLIIQPNIASITTPDSFILPFPLISTTSTSPFNSIQIQQKQISFYPSKYHLSINIPISKFAKTPISHLNKWCATEEEQEILKILRNPVNNIIQNIKNNIQPRNKSIHNLTNLDIPTYVIRTLEKGSDFAIRPKEWDKEYFTSIIRSTFNRIIIREKFNIEKIHQPLIPKSQLNWIPNSKLAKLLNQLYETEKENFSMEKPKVFYNLSRTEKQGLKWIKEKPEIMIIAADKNLGLCIINKEEYIERIKLELNKSADSYKILIFNEEELHIRRKKSFNQLEEITNHIKESVGGSIIKKFIMEPNKKEFNICKLKGLIKLHKPGRKMRLIFPFNNHPFSNLHKFLAKCLDYFVQKTPSVITNVMEIIHKITMTDFNANTVICSADIESMYPNIDREQALQITQQKLSEINIFNIDANWMWRRLLEIAHFDLEFKFDSILYEQIKGVPIGSPAGPQIAINYLHSKISKEWENLQQYLIYAGIYFDDAIFIFKDGTDNIENKIQQLLENTTLKFDQNSIKIKTIKDLETEQFDFLDISIKSEKKPSSNTYRCYTKVYTKEIGCSQYIHWKSSHPPSVKRSIIKGELLRRLRLTDKQNDWVETKKDLYNKLLDRKYPKTVLKKEFEKVNFSSQKFEREKLTTKIFKRRTNSKFPYSAEKIIPNIHQTIPIITIYDPRNLRIIKRKRKELQDKINEILNKGNFKIKKIRLINAFKVSNKLNKYLNTEKTAVLFPKP